MSEPKVYLAGPEVFLKDAAEFGDRKKALCEKYGLKGLFPFDNEIGPGAGDMSIYRANLELIKSADFGVFNLTPFRGSGADVGTVFELGLMNGLAKPCFGYTNDTRELRERVESTTGASRDQLSGTWRDHLEMTVEDFGNADNLMVDCSLRWSGFTIFRNPASKLELFRDLRGFEACLQAIARFVRTQPLPKTA